MNPTAQQAGDRYGPDIHHTAIVMRQIREVIHRIFPYLSVCK
ncbi:MAG: hypothetical protein ACFE0J_07250 [Elainellaceae cyanobacterium]